MIQEKLLMIKNHRIGLMFNKMKYQLLINLILLSGLYSISVTADIRKVESCLVSTSQKCDVKLRDI